MMTKVKLANRWVGEGEPAFVIAEVGSNHDRKLEQAKELIEVAAQAGADAVKFQLFMAEYLYPVGVPMFAVVKENELPREWVPELAEHAQRKGLVFFASPFDRPAVDLLETIGVCAYKWASSETVDLAFLKYAAAKRKPILISTGMCDLADVHEAVAVVRSESNDGIILLQCTSLYPTEPRHVHLRVMDTLRTAFQVPVGFSDHTTDTVIPAVAVARGACVLEKHLTLSRKLRGPDHEYALEPQEFAKMIINIRATEAALGSSLKTMLAEEAMVARRTSIRASRDISVGEELTREHLVLGRPADGIRPRFFDAVVGRRVRQPIRKGDAVTWEKI